MYFQVLYLHYNMLHKIVDIFKCTVCTAKFIYVIHLQLEIDNKKSVMNSASR
jgi:hypothetical protein